jgi:hypothetical protein
MIQNNNSPTIQNQPHQQQQHDQDQTIADMIPDEQTVLQENNENNLKYLQQHYMPHKQVHSMDKFSMNNATTKLPAQLSNIQENSEHTQNTQETNNTNNNNAQPLVNIQFKKNQQTSIIDLNELDEAQLKQLQAEEQKEQEYFNIEHLNRMHIQLDFLYKIRGKKLEEMSARFNAYQEDMSREMRAMKHRLFLAEKEKESVQTSLDQAHELCNQYKTETDEANSKAKELQDMFDKLKQSNRVLEQKLSEQEQEIESLHAQLNEQQKLDTLERVQEHHEHFVQQLRDQYETNLFQMKENFAQCQNELNDKCELIKLLKNELDTATKNSEMTALDKAESINRLTKSLSDLQNKYNQDILMVGLSNRYVCINKYICKINSNFEPYSSDSNGPSNNTYRYGKERFVKLRFILV